MTGGMPSVEFVARLEHLAQAIARDVRTRPANAHRPRESNVPTEQLVRRIREVGRLRFDERVDEVFAPGLPGLVFQNRFSTEGGHQSRGKSLRTSL